MMSQSASDVIPVMLNIHTLRYDCAFSSLVRQFSLLPAGTVCTDIAAQFSTVLDGVIDITEILSGRVKWCTGVSLVPTKMH